MMGAVVGGARSWLRIWAVGLSIAAGCGSRTGSSGPDAATGVARLRLVIAYGKTDDFGPIPTNATAFRTCRLSNVGRGPTELDAISFQAGTSADFTIESGDCGFYPGYGIPAGATCSFTIGFSPSAEESETGTVVVAGANGDMPSVTFMGRGAAPVPISEYPIPTANSSPLTIGAGSDGALWFIENQPHRIGRITTAATFTEYPFPLVNAALLAVAPGPESDGALWYVDSDNNQVVRIAVDGTISTYPTPTLNDPQGIALGPDGALWVSAYGGTVGRLTTAGVVTGTFAIPTLNAGADSIAAGSAQTLWFTEYDAGQIARVDLDGSITEFAIPGQPQGAVAITGGPDGRSWFVDSGDVGAITTKGAITLTPAPHAGGAGTVIATGSDHALWFTEPSANRMGRVNTNGDVYEVRLPTADAQPTGLAVGADGAIWFVEAAANRIGRLVPGPP
jgi:virginiamycin B lyase